MTKQAASRPEQLALPLPHHAAMGADDFMVTPSNAAAVAWVRKWPGWTGRILLLHGPKGSGKTHLTKVWQEMTQARAVNALSLRQAILADDRMIIDDVPSLLKQPDDEQALHHIINLVREQNGSLLLAAELPPARWNVKLPDLKSRLLALPVAELQAPDDALLAGLLVKQFHDRQLAVAPEVIDFLLPRIERRAESITHLVMALDQAALKAGRAVTIPLAKQVLEKASSPELKGL